jgi:large subunit ribosomal protein L30e
MATKKSITSTEIKNLIKSRSIIIGTERTIKGLKLGKIDKVLLSSNCSGRVIDNITHYAALSKVETIKVGYPNEELGVICKKPFSISVLSVLKGE